MKQKLIDVLNLKYKKDKNFNSSNRTDYNIYANNLEELNQTLLELDAFVESDLITNLCVFVRNEDQKYKILFTVDFGYKDGIE